MLFVCSVGQHLEPMHFQAGFTAIGHFLAAFPLDWLSLRPLSDTCSCTDCRPWLFGALPLMSLQGCGIWGDALSGSLTSPLASQGGLAENVRESCEGPLTLVNTEDSVSPRAPCPTPWPPVFPDITASRVNWASVQKMKSTSVPCA